MERERRKVREAETETDRKRETERDREGDRQRERERETDRDREGEIQRESERQRERVEMPEFDCAGPVSLRPVGDCATTTDWIRPVSGTGRTRGRHHSQAWSDCQGETTQPVRPWVSWRQDGERRGAGEEGN